VAFFCSYHSKSDSLTEKEKKMSLKRGGFLFAGFILFFIFSMASTAVGQEKAAQETAEQEVTEQETVTQDSDAKKVFLLDEILVTAEELEKDIQTPNMTTVKPELFPMGIGTTVDAALERQPGVDVQRIQEVGTAVDDDSIKIRGFGSRRIKVMRDDRPLNTAGVAGGYFIDWTMIPLTNVDRIEVIKGVSDPRYGNVLGGVVNLVSKKLPTDKPETEFAVTSASFGTLSMDAYNAWKPGPFEYAISVGTMTSDGYLHNGDLESGNMDLHLGYDVSAKTNVYSDIAYRKLKKGFIVNNRKSNDPDDPLYDVPVDPDYPASDGEYMYGGMGATAEPGSWWEKEVMLYNFGLKQQVADAGKLSVNYWFDHGDREAFNTRTSADRIFHKTFYDDRSWGASTQYSHELTSQTLTAGADFDYLKDDGDTNHSDDFREPFRNGYYVAAKNVGAYVMDEVRLYDEKFWVTPGMRYMAYDGNAGPSGVTEGIPDIDMDGWAPSLKITYNYIGNDLFYVSAARALRMPTPPEHYWHYDADDAGVDTSKLPFNEEDGVMLQSGWQAEFDTKTKVEFSPYYYRIDDYIQFDLINFVSYNIDKAELYGAEFQVTQQLPMGFSTFANYTYQKSKADGDPFVENFVVPEDRGFDEVPGLPEHKGNIGFQYKADKKGKIALYLKGVSSQKVIYNNNTLWNTDLKVCTQDSYVSMDMEGSYPVTKIFEVAVFANDLLDNDYQERYGFPAAGRTIGTTLRAKF
jgi:outer membrane receptor protein involved in Fe transport